MRLSVAVRSRGGTAAFPSLGAIVYAGALIFLGYEGFELIAVAAIVSTGSAINATLYGAAKFTYLMAHHGELPERLGEPIWNRPIAGLLATALAGEAIMRRRRNPD